MTHRLYGLEKDNKLNSLIDYIFLVLAASDLSKDRCVRTRLCLNVFCGYAAIRGFDFVCNVFAIFPVVLFNLAVSLMHVSTFGFRQLPPFPSKSKVLSETARRCCPSFPWGRSFFTNSMLFAALALCCALFPPVLPDTWIYCFFPLSISLVFLSTPFFLLSILLLHHKVSLTFFSPFSHFSPSEFLNVLDVNASIFPSVYILPSLSLWW